MDARPQVERGTAGLKLSVTAKPYNYEIEHLNPLPLSASPAPAPQTWLTSPQWLQQQATQSQRWVICKQSSGQKLETKILGFVFKSSVRFN